MSNEYCGREHLSLNILCGLPKGHDGGHVYSIIPAPTSVVVPVSVETSKPADLLKEERIKRAMEALEDLPRFKLSRQELDAAMEAAEYEEIAAQVALPPEKILSINAAQELVDEIKRLKAAHISEVERLTKERDDLVWQLNDMQIQRNSEFAKYKAEKKIREAAESKLSQLQEELGRANRDLTIKDCKVCHGSGEFIDSEAGGFIVKCHCWANLVDTLRKEIKKSQLANEEKARKIAERVAVDPNIVEQLVPLILSILNGGQ